jgi:hypothetical protein
MKFNSTYEVAIKKNVARFMEIKEFTLFIRDVHRLIFNRKQLSRNLTIIINLYELEILENKNSSRKVFRAKRKKYS